MNLRRFLVLSQRTSFDYYVDSAGGADTNNGRSAAGAFKTIGALSGKITAGVKIGLKCGSSWREELVIAADNVKVGAYGTGAKPILDASDILAAASFSKTAGRTFIYQITVNVITGWTSVWEDSTRLVRVADLATCDATAGSYYCVDAAGAMVLYIHATDGTNPGTNGKVYEATLARYSGIYAPSQTGIIITGIHTKRNRHDSGSIVVGRNAVITDCLCSEGTKHNLYFAGGSVLRNVEARDAYYGAGGGKTYFVANEDNPDGSPIWIENCHANNTGTYDDTAEGFYGHRNVAGNFGIVTYNTCTVTGLCYAFDMFSATRLDIINCTATGCRWPIYAQVDINASDCLFTAGAANFNMMVVAQTGLNITLTRIHCDKPTSLGTYYIQPQVAQAFNLTMDHCVFDTDTNGVIVWMAADNAHLTAHYNQYGSAGYTNGNIYLVMGAAPTLDCDYNIFRQNVCTFNVAGTYYFNVADFRTGTGQELNSTIVT